MAQADQVSAPPAASDDNRMEDETNNTSGAPAANIAASNTTMDSELTSDKGAITYEDKLNQIKEALTTHSVPVQEGENWYVVDAKWLASFFDEASRMSPGPIDNSHLVDETSDGIYRVKDEIQEQQDYDLVPEEIWNLFQSWFGGGPAIPRKSVIQNPEAFKISYTVEVRPCEISVALQSTSSHLEWVDFEFSKNATIKQVMDQVKRDFNIQSRECKLWKTIYNSPHEEVDLSAVEDQTLEHALERKTGQRFIVEVGPNWIIEPPVSESSNNAIRSMTTNKIQISGTTAQQKKKYDSAPPGVCGLSNLGNTCFMNSGLQCLTHAPVLYRYFLENDYSKEINETNPLGMGGAVALAFGALMKEMWSGENSYFSPNDFKRVIGKYAPQFAGYQQQDSQELISFILDGLHEDLNRIQKKPATNPVEAKGREDAVVAQESWEVHKLRNDSIIVDKFQGQLKSTLHCPKCENFSIIFDPFMYLSLPIPIEKNRLINIMVFSNSTLNNEVESTLDADLSKLSNMPTRLTCKVTKTGSVSQLRDTVLELLGLNPNEDHDRCVLYEIFSNKVYKYLSDGDSISNILDSDTIHCQILPKASETTVDSKFVTSGKGIEKLNNLPKNVHSLYRQTYSNTQLQLPFLQVSLSSHITDRYGRKSFQIIGAPFVIPLGQIFEEKKEDQEVNVPTHEDLYEYCFHYMLRYVKDEFVAEIEQNMKERSLTFKDFLPSKEKLEGLKAGENIEENLSMFYLFDQEGSRFEVSERSFDGALLCDETEFKPYAPKYSSPRTEKKSIYMHIPSFFHDKMLDYEKLPRFKEHPSTKQKISQSEAINIYQCLDLYTSKEKLGANDTWYCPNCKEHVEATKKFDIWKVPDVLVIHLKRFSFSTYSRDKIDRFIDYPIQDLDISSFVHCKDLNLKYDLFAVSDHFGGLGGGHYTACAKNHVDGKWYKFDDSRSSEVHNPESIKASSNYVLFYIRKE